MKTAFEKMMNGLDEVETFLVGNEKGFKVHVPGEVDIKAIRTRLGLTQARFSDTFGFSLDSLKNWESHRRTPDSSARILLTVISQDPAAVVLALFPEAKRLDLRKSRTEENFKLAKKLMAKAARAGA
jgi:putative transcriptional regulator